MKIIFCFASCGFSEKCYLVVVWCWLWDAGWCGRRGWCHMLVCILLSSNVSLLNHCFQNAFGFWHCKTNFQVLPIVVFGLVQTFILFRPNLNMGRKSSTQSAEIEFFCQLIMSHFILVPGSEFEFF